MCDISARAALRRGPRESENVSGSMFSIIPVSPLLHFFTCALLFFSVSFPELPLPPRVAVAGKQMARARMTTRQEEESAENGSDRERMGKPYLECERPGGSRCVEREMTLWSFSPHVLGGLRSNPPIAPLPSTSEERRPQRATRLGVP